MGNSSLIVNSKKKNHQNKKIEFQDNQKEIQIPQSNSTNVFSSNKKNQNLNEKKLPLIYFIGLFKKKKTKGSRNTFTDELNIPGEKVDKQPLNSKNDSKIFDSKNRSQDVQEKKSIRKILVFYLRLFSKKKKKNLFFLQLLHLHFMEKS